MTQNPPDNVRSRRLLFGAGYVGQRIVARWISRGDRVTIVTRSEDSADRWRSQGLDAVVANVVDRDSLEAGFRSIAAPFDTAMYCVGYDARSGEDRQSVAVDGPTNAIATLAGQVCHWTFTSSTSVYGQTDGQDVDETSPTEPTTDSGKRCVAAEQAVRESASSVAILRLAGLYGPGRVLARAETLREQRPFPGSGDQWLNLIHAEDAAAACVAAGDKQATGTWLVSDDEPVRREDYYGLLAELLSLPKPVFDNEPRVGRGAGNKRCANAKLKASLVSPLMYPTFRDGLQDALQRHS